MIPEPQFPVEPWSVRENRLDLDLMAQSESVFALSNGHIGLRGNLDEGDPHGIPGTYLNSFYELRPLPYAEAGYGYPESGQTVVNVTNGKIIRLLVDDEPFDIRYGKLRSHERVLDLKAGVLRRAVEWESPTHRVIKVRSTRMVSLVHRALAAILYEVEPVDGAADFVLQSELVANEPSPASLLDPRAAAVLNAPLAAELHDHSNGRIVLVHTTKASGLRMAAGMDHVTDGPTDVEVTSESEDDLARVNGAGGDEGAIQDEVGPGCHQQLVLVTLGLALGAVRDDDRRAFRRDHRAPLDSDRKRSAASAGELAADQGFDERATG